MNDVIERYVQAAYQAREEAADEWECAEKERRAKWVTRAGDLIEQHKLRSLVNALGIESHNPQFPEGGWIQIAYPLTLEIGGQVYNLEFAMGQDDAGIPCQMLRCSDLSWQVPLPATDVEIGEFFIILQERAAERTSEAGNG